MGDSENSLQPSKKRAALKELSRDNPGLDDEEGADQETGTFKRASEEVMASRKIVKVRRKETISCTTAPSSNPFAAIRLVQTAESTSKVESDASKEDIKEPDQNSKPSEGVVDESSADMERVEVPAEPDKSESTEKKVAEDELTQDESKESAVAEKGEKDSKEDVKGDEKAENEVKNDVGGEESEKGSAESAAFNSFQQLSSSKNAFTGLAGTGFSGMTFSFGAISKEGSESGAGTGSVFGAKSDQSSPFGLNLPTNGNVSLFGNSRPSITNKSEGTGFPSKQEVNVETGEENEKPVFTADSVLFEFQDGGWKERGKGELKVNISTSGVGKARLVMRTKGNYRLILNANLYPEMKLANMEKRGVTFACLNSAGDGKDKLTTIALKFKDASIVEEFRAAVEEHKGSVATSSLKTPENSPKASDD